MDGESKAEPVTISTPQSAVEIDPQNPLPEGSWFWRRLLTITISAVSLFFIWHILESLHDLQDAGSLLELSKWIIGLMALVLTYYFIGPSAAELVNMIQSSKIIRSGIEMANDRLERGHGRPGRHRPARFQGSVSADSQIPGEALSGAPGASDEEDAAPRGRT